MSKFKEYMFWILSNIVGCVVSIMFIKYAGADIEFIRSYLVIYWIVAILIRGGLIAWEESK